MKIGLFFYATELGCPVSDVGRLAEDHGLESLFVCEHTHVPAPPTPYVDPDGKVLPQYYSHLYDPLITLAALASVTENLLLGTAVCIATQRDPILLAKEVATLDQLSRGRIILGVGTGWSEDEMRAHHVDASRPFGVLRDTMLMTRALWTSTSVPVPHVDNGMKPIAQWPLPVQQPNPPVLVAGNGPRILQRVEEYGDGWLITYKHPDLERACAELRELRERTEKPYPATIIAGSDDVSALARYAELGIDRAILAVRPTPYAETEQRIRRIAEISAETLDRAAA